MNSTDGISFIGLFSFFGGEGEKLIHEISSTDPRYTYEETQNLIDEYRRRGYAPPTCQYFGCNRCNLEPKIGKDSRKHKPSPIRFAYRTWKEF